MPAKVRVGRSDGWLLSTGSGLQACYGEAPPSAGLLYFGSRWLRGGALSAGATARRGERLIEAGRPHDGANGANGWLKRHRPRGGAARRQAGRGALRAAPV